MQPEIQETMSAPTHPWPGRRAVNSWTFLHADLQVTQEGADDRVSGTHADRHDNISDDGRFWGWRQC